MSNTEFGEWVPLSTLPVGSWFERQDNHCAYRKDKRSDIIGSGEWWCISAILYNGAGQFVHEATLVHEVPVPTQSAEPSPLDEATIRADERAKALKEVYGKMDALREEYIARMRNHKTDSYRWVRLDTEVNEINHVQTLITRMPGYKE